MQGGFENSKTRTLSRCPSTFRGFTKLADPAITLSSPKRVRRLALRLSVLPRRACMLGAFCHCHAVRWFVVWRLLCRRIGVTGSVGRFRMPSAEDWLTRMCERDSRTAPVGCLSGKELARMYTMYTSQQPAGRYKVTEFTDMIWAHGRQSRTAVWRGQPGSGFARGQRAQVQVHIPRRAPALLPGSF